MSITVVSQQVFEMLISHLIKIEDERAYVIEKYYPRLTDERQSFQEILDSYIRDLEKIICNEVKVGGNASEAFPFVIIGCRMLLRDEVTKIAEDIRIISPFNGEVDLNMDSASYLSPVGRAFLLKKLNDRVRVETPMGPLHYRIEAIEVSEDMKQFF